MEPTSRAIGTIKWVWMQVKNLEHCLARGREGLSTHLLLLLTPYHHIIISEDGLQRGSYPVRATWSMCSFAWGHDGSSTPFIATGHKNHGQDGQGKTATNCQQNLVYLLDHWNCFCVCSQRCFPNEHLLVKNLMCFPLNTAIFSLPNTAPPRERTVQPQLPSPPGTLGF